MLKMLILENNFREKSAFALFAKFVAFEKKAPYGTAKCACMEINILSNYNHIANCG